MSGRRSAISGTPGPDEAPNTRADKENTFLDAGARRLVARSLRRNHFWARLLTPLCVGAPLLFGAIQWFNPKNGTLGQRWLLVFLVQAGVFLFGLIPWEFFQRSKRLAADIELGELESLRGPVVSRLHDDGGHRVQIAGEWTKISRSAYRRLQCGDVAKIVRTPHQKLVLSITDEAGRELHRPE